ncbi:MAG TPA: TetR/AcrR family transcriptional regulator [Bacillaceae bacterium]|nr:TetR/AcrR family transcriptional regulator [Paenibacillus bovis]HLU21663.1 TetR/AcrR family transcriptional regulator [Bacillaceae bacterium]
MARVRKFTTAELFQATKQGLLQFGYESFTFSLLAEQLEVSRGTLYKYYENKEELITDYMLFEMNLFLQELREIHHQNSFEEQFDFLFDLIFKNEEIHQLIAMGNQINTNISNKANENKKELDRLHLEMYQILSGFIQNGKKEGQLKSELQDSLLLGIIFQTVAIPNHSRVPKDEWVRSIKDIIRHGMFIN